ncbi:MAG: hypothetical protein QXK83_06940, partial [Zestosphaera sp.]
MSSKKKSKFPTLMSLNTIEAFQGHLVTWLADVATTYLINVRLSSSIKDKVKTLCQMADDYIADLKKRDLNACRDISLPPPPNFEENYFDLCKAVEVICDYSRGKMET